METLDAMERVGTTSKDVPIADITILEMTVFVDPYKNILDAIDDTQARKTQNEIKKEEKVVISDCS
jgi:hypothetical protein